MNTQYIQLPSLPIGLPTEIIEIIWLYARLPESEQEIIRDFIQENLKKDNNLDETELAKMLQESGTEVNPDIKEFSGLMRKLLGTLMAQSCEIAAIVYQNHCIREKTAEEISKEFNIDEESIRIMVQYYDKK